MTYQHYRSPFGDTTFTKVFVGGLAWETPTDEMHNYFQQFGEILEAVIITDKNTGKSKGYGFVTFRDPESARRACAEPNPVIDGRRANCNVASLGRPRPSPPRGRFQGGNPSYSGGGAPHGQGAPSLYGGVSGILPPPPPPLPQPVIYPPYGYQHYSPDIGYHQAVYNTQQPQYYNQMYGTTSNPNMSGGSPYYYHGYSMQASRGAYPAPHAQRIQGPSYVYYPTQQMAEGSYSSYPTPPQLQPLQLPATSGRQQHFPSSSDIVPAQRPSTEPEPQQITSSESPNT